MRRAKDEDVLLFKLIHIIMILEDKAEEDARELTGWSRSTYYRKKLHPETVTLAEFRDLANGLHLTDDEVLEITGRRRKR